VDDGRIGQGIFHSRELQVVLAVLSVADMRNLFVHRATAITAFVDAVFRELVAVFFLAHDIFQFSVALINALIVGQFSLASTHEHSSFPSQLSQIH